MQSIVLSRRNIKENDQIISFYTLEKGKKEILARGVKKIISKNSAHLESFSFVDAEIISGKEIDYLGAVQPINYFVNIRKDLKKGLAAGALVFALDKLLHEGERDEKVFGLLLSWLEHLNNIKEYDNILLDAFFVKLLSLLGFNITEVKNVVGSAKEDLTFLEKSSWQEINIFVYKKSLHNFIYKFLLFNTDRKIGDWGKLPLN